jgi:5'-deoxynucleotidase YfbR-like HD superfamily hydrolase
MDNGQKRGSLQKWLTRLTQQIASVWRWKHYEHTNKQNVLEHTLETALLTQIVIALERQLGNFKFDTYRLLASAINHDLGEGIIGDVAYGIKNDPRIKKHIETIEKEEFRKLFDHLGLSVNAMTMVAEAFDYSFVLQDESETVEGRLFNAIERLGYVLFALRELESPDRKHFVGVLKNHHGELLKYSKEFISIGILYDVCLKEIRQLPTSWILSFDFQEVFL